MSEPRSIAEAPESIIIYGGSIIKEYMEILMNTTCGDHIAIARDNAWIKQRIQRMIQTVPNGVFVGVDGSRFDST
jgi:hypothetical protein